MSSLVYKEETLCFMMNSLSPSLLFYMIIFMVWTWHKLRHLGWIQFVLTTQQDGVALLKSQCLPENYWVTSTEKSSFKNLHADNTAKDNSLFCVLISFFGIINVKAKSAKTGPLLFVYFMSFYTPPAYLVLSQ